MTIETAFNIVVIIFTVANIGAMGLEMNLREALKTMLKRYNLLELIGEEHIYPTNRHAVAACREKS